MDGSMRRAASDPSTLTLSFLNFNPTFFIFVSFRIIAFQRRPKCESRQADTVLQNMAP
jgi:hypothetical protein